MSQSRLTAWALTVTCLLLAALEAPAASVSLVSKGVHVDALPVAGDAHHGYVPHRFEVRNSSSKKRTITLTMPADPAEDAKHAIRTIQRTVTVAPGTAVKVLMLQPPLPMGLSANDLRVEVEGQRKILKSAFLPRHDDAMNLGFQSPRLVLLSRSVDQKDYEDEANRMISVGGSGPSGTGPHGHGHGHSHGVSEQFAIFESAPSSMKGWDTHWLAYSLYDAIVLTGNEWQTAPNEVRRTVERWVRCGGQLFVLERNEFTALDGWMDDPASTPRVNLLRAGFGSCYLYQNNDEFARDKILDQLKKDRDQLITLPLLQPLAMGMQAMHDTEMHHYSRSPFGGPRDNEDFNRYFQVVGSSRVPVRLVLGLLTVFVILAGPVSLIILHRKQKRLWFLWTLPALSFSISALVFVVSWFSEGITPRLRIDGITILDQTAQEATTIGGVGLYAPVAPGSLNFSGNTEATPLFEPQVDDPGSDRRVLWTAGGGQMLEGGWVGSRVPTHFAIRKTEHREERIEVKWNSANEPEISNYLGQNIRELYLCGDDGVLYFGDEITAGSKAILKRRSSSISFGSQRSGYRDLVKITMEFSERGRHNATSDIADRLVSNTYIARLDTSPFIENPLGQRKAETKFRSHVIGILPEGRSP